MKNFQIIQTDGLNGNFDISKFVKPSYNNADDAVIDFLKLISETEKTERYVNDVRKSENWNENYEVKQSERFCIEICAFEKNEDDDEPQLIPFNGMEFSESSKSALISKNIPTTDWIVSDDFYIS